MGNRWIKEDKAQLLSMYKSSMSIEDLAIRFNRSSRAIRDCLFDLGIQISGKQKYGGTISCKHCGVEKKVRKKSMVAKTVFCSHACASSFNNVARVKERKKCLICGAVVESHRSYCSRSCYGISKSLHGDFALRNDNGEMMSKVERWLNGEYSLGGNSKGQVNTLIRRYLIEKADNKCSKCGWSEMHEVTKRVPLTIDHIDGDATNGHPNNVRVLCCNCHSLTPTYGSLNKGRGRRNRYKMV